MRYLFAGPWMSSIFAFALGVMLSFLPGLGTFGIGGAISLGFILPSIAAWRGIAQGQAWTIERPARLPFGSTLHCIGSNIGLTCITILGLVPMQLQRGLCEPLNAAVFFILGPVSSVALASTFGFTVGTQFGKRRWSYLLALTPLIAELGILAFRLYGSPAVFSYHHFIGYIPGPLYDTNLRVDLSYLYFRTMTAFILLGLAAWAILVAVIRDRSLVSSQARAVVLCVLALGCSAAAIVVEQLFGDRLGTSTSFAHVTDELGMEVTGAHCRVVFPSTRSKKTARLYARDCDFYVKYLQKKLGVQRKLHIRVFLFSNIKQKRALMGAGGTMIAKPWQHAVYLDWRAWPHPSFHHELVHAVSGYLLSHWTAVPHYPSTPIPDMGIIEGLAVALDTPNSEFTSDEISSAALGKGKLPSIADLRGLGFLKTDATIAYHASGSFLRFIAEHTSYRKLGVLYRSGDFTKAFSHPVGYWEELWRKRLSSVDISESRRSVLDVALSKQPIIYMKCPHTLGRKMDDIQKQVQHGQWRMALRTCKEVLDIQPYHAEALSLSLDLTARTQGIQVARRYLRNHIDKMPAAIQAQLKETMADGYWLFGHRTEAHELYTQVLKLPLNEENRRAAEVKQMTVQSPYGDEPSWKSYFTETRQHASYAHDLVSLYSAVEKRKAADGLAEYVLGLRLFGLEQYEAANEFLRRSLQHPPPSPSVHLNMMKLTALASFAIGDTAAAVFAWQRLLESPLSSEKHKLWAEQWLDITSSEVSAHGRVPNAPQ